MEQNVRFGQVLGWLAVLKNLDRGVQNATFGDNFLMLSCEIILRKKYCSVCTKMLYNVKLRKP